MNKSLSFLLSVFFVVGLVAPSSFVFAQDAGTSPSSSPAPVISPAPTESPASQPSTTQPTTQACPPTPATPSCGPGENLKAAFDDHGCLISQYCFKLESGEQQRSCPLVSKEAFDSCSSRGGNPITHTGQDGCAILKCERQEGFQPQGPPQGCKEEVDPAGFKRIVCEGPQGGGQGCPSDKQQMEQQRKDQCLSKGGNPISFHDPNGCQFFNCEFQQRGPQSQSRAFSGGGQALGLEKRNCPTRAQADEAFKKCQSVGQEGFYVGPSDCRFVECRNVEAFKDKFRCDESRNFARIDDLVQKCGGKQNVIKDWDASGCAFPRCKEQGDGSQDEGRGPPPEFFERCEKDGGRIADFGQGRVTCVPPKSKGKLEKGLRQDEVLALAEVGEGDVLKLGLKLETAKIALNEAKNALEDAANYWDLQNAPEESERVRRAARILDKASKKLDKAKLNIVKKIEDKDISIDDLIEIKEKIKETIEDIEIDATTALLGGESKEAPDADVDTDELTENAENCIVGVFNVDTGEEGPEVTVDIKGIDGDGDCNGSMKVSFANSQFKPPIPPVTEAACKDIDVLAASTSGDRPPSKEELAEAGCVGTFVDNLDKMVPGIPGKCQGEECKDYCGTSETAAKECLEAFKDFLPPEAKVGLTLMTAFGGGPDGIREGFEKAFSGGQESAKAFLAKVESALQSAGISLDQVPGDMKQGIEALKALSEGRLPSFGGPGGFGDRGSGADFGFSGGFGEEEDHGFVGPGGCRGPFECESYCKQNPEECSQAFGHEEGGERVRDQFGREFSVGGGDEGFKDGPQPRNFERFRQDESKFVGPGGCTTKSECEAQFRNNPEAFKSSFGSEFRPPPGFEGRSPPQGFQPPSGFNQPNQPFPQQSGNFQPPQGGDFGNFRPPEGGNFPPPGDFGNFRPPEGGSFNQPPGDFQPPSGFNPPPGDFGNFQPPPSGFDSGFSQPPPEGSGGFSQPPSGFFVGRR